MTLPGVVYPLFFEYYKAPVKIVETSDGGLAVWRTSIDTGGWESVNHLLEVILVGDGEVSGLSQSLFVQRVERYRLRYLPGGGPVHELYGVVRVIFNTARAQRRALTAEEGTLVQETLRRTFVMFEEQLLRAGDPGADPTLVA